jgi:ABC-type branched-subunit amino acid transport system ATPase component
MAEELLRIEGLHKRFGGVVATDGVTLDVTRGEVHALIGPNGAGKTTLIAQISGSLAPDAGRILFGVADITSLPQHARVAAGLARSYQITSIFKRFTVAQNLALAVQARSGSPSSTACAKQSPSCSWSTTWTRCSSSRTGSRSSSAGQSSQPASRTRSAQTRKSSAPTSVTR